MKSLTLTNTNKFWNTSLQLSFSNRLKPTVAAVDQTPNVPVCCCVNTVKLRRQYE